jgi:microcystin-dependent protein
MSCTNCFNGCTEITSDKCVRYTGADIPTLGIQNGDTLLFVEQTLAQFIISALDGSGIKPAIDPSIICSVVSANLPTCGEFTITDLTTALIKSICDLQESIDATVADIADINAELGVLNAPYSVPACIEGTVDNESTHSVLQALLVNFCALVISLPETYVALNGPGGIGDIISQTLEEEGITGPNIKEYTKMVPYVAYPWFAPADYVTGKFGSTGEGLASGPYQYVNFCNGQNGTPDLRGRVLAGVTNGMLGGGFDPEVDPSLPGNPTYFANPFTTTGANFVTLGPTQIPAHNHSATTVVRIDDPEHNHTFSASNGGDGIGGGYPVTGGPQEGGGSFGMQNNKTGLKGTGAGQNVFVDVTINNTGNNLPHANIQPTIGCYYIMYIPPAP